MTIEEKAKRYDEAVERAKSKIKNDKDHVLYEDDIIELFPVLKESEDERVRKELLAVVGDLVLPNEQQSRFVAWLEKQGEQNPYSGVSFKYNGHAWSMCARDNGVEVLIDGHLDRVFTIDSNAKEMFIKALERVEEQNAKGYKLTDCDKNSWWEDFKAYTYCTIEQKTADNVEPKFHKGEWITIKE